MARGMMEQYKDGYLLMWDETRIAICEECGKPIVEDEEFYSASVFGPEPVIYGHMQCPEGEEE